MSQDARIFAVNETDLIRLMESREAFLGGSIDAKRPTAWRQYGYPEDVTFPMLFQAYRRGGAGQGAVHRLLDGCWQELPRIKTKGSEGEPSDWEKRLAQKFKDLGLWAKLRDLDRRNMVGHYSALIYRVADNLQLREPLQKGQKLVDVVPLYEDQLTVTKWDTDPASADFGKPAMYQYRMRPVAAQQPGGQARPDLMVDVHPSRVQILAEGSIGDMFDGVPLLLAGFNHLIDLEKIGGGSAESYLKNSARAIVFAYDPQSNVRAITTDGGGAPDGSAGKSVREVHEEQARALNRNIDAAIVMQGGKAETLQTQQSDPQPAFEVAACLFSASVRIPFTVLFGQQTGRLASDEDQKDWTKRCQSRQANELTSMIEQFVKRMQEAGLFEAGEFEVEWPDIGAPSDEERLANAKAMAEINQITFNGGGTEPPFDGEEIRKAAGYEERTGAPDEFKEDTPTPEEVAAAAAKQGAKPTVKKPATSAS